MQEACQPNWYVNCRECKKRATQARTRNVSKKHANLIGTLIAESARSVPRRMPHIETGWWV